MRCSTIAHFMVGGTTRLVIGFVHAAFFQTVDRLLDVVIRFFKLMRFIPTSFSQ